MSYKVGDRVEFMRDNINLTRGTVESISDGMAVLKDMVDLFGPVSYKGRVPASALTGIPHTEVKL